VVPPPSIRPSWMPTRAVRDEIACRRKGFQWPWHPLQVLSWVVFLGVLADFILVFSLMVYDLPGIILSAAYGIPFLCAWMSAAYAMAVDPADPGVLAKAAVIRAGGIWREGTAPVEALFCSTCAVHVRKGALHCNVCDKCVDGYDHHCPWLNTCIGARNYRAFLVMVVSLTVVCGLHVAAFTYAGAQLANGDPELLHRASTTLGLSSIGCAVVLAVSGGGMLVLFLNLLPQLFLHARARWHGLGTYEDFLRHERSRPGNRRNRVQPQPPEV